MAKLFIQLKPYRLAPVYDAKGAKVRGAFRFTAIDRIVTKDLPVPARAYVRICEVVHHKVDAETLFIMSVTDYRTCVTDKRKMEALRRYVAESVRGDSDSAWRGDYRHGENFRDAFVAVYIGGAK